MKWMLSSLVFMLLLMGCKTEKLIVNRQFKDDKGSYEMIGEQVRNAFLHPNYSNWFVEGYDNYKPNPEVIKKLKPLLKGVKIDVFYGSWCGDSKMYVPQFFRILDEAEVSEHSYRIFAVNRKKESFYGEEQGKNIIHVPTFIFYNNKNVIQSKGELNRIIESPVGNTLEEDMLKILSGESYTPNYYF